MNSSPFKDSLPQVFDKDQLVKIVDSIFQRCSSFSDFVEAIAINCDSIEQHFRECSNYPENQGAADDWRTLSEKFRKVLT